MVADAGALEPSVTGVDDPGAIDVIVLCEVSVLLLLPVPDTAREADDATAEVASCLFGFWPGNVTLGITIPLREHETTNSSTVVCGRV